MLEEQKSVMNKCGEERRRLAAEWVEYFREEKVSKERGEGEAERAMHADSQREGTIISLTKVGPRAQDRACQGALDSLRPGNKSIARAQHESRNWNRGQQPGSLPFRRLCVHSSLIC